MWSGKYWPQRYWPARYWPKGTGSPPVTPPDFIMLSGDQIQQPTLLSQELRELNNDGLGIRNPDLAGQDIKGSN